MQEAAGTIPHWMQIALTVLASSVTGIGIDRLYNNWLNRKKPAAEIHVTEANATEIKIRSSAAAGDAVVRFMDRLDTAQATIDRIRAESQETIDRLRAERDAWQDEYDKVFVERDRALMENAKLKGEVDLYEKEIKRMAATLTLQEKNYDNTKHQKIGPIEAE